jgi:hypothetical protein
MPLNSLGRRVLWGHRTPPLSPTVEEAAVIVRESYLQRIRPFYDAPFIKVITGVRRCGKSVLLRQIAAEIRELHGPGCSTVFVDFDDYANRALLDPDALFAYIRERLAPDAKTYLFFDEIQAVRDFELVVNSLNTTDDVSIFLTGSNSKLLSGELATKLGGRTLSFLVMPFSFREFCQFCAQRDPGEDRRPDELLGEYLRWGGFPLVCGLRDDAEKRVVLDNLYDSIVLRDIIQRNRVSSPAALENVLDYLIANSSATVSGNTIAAALSDANRKVSAPTVYDLIGYIESSCVLNRAERYDIRGKRVLAFEAKDYVCDLGLFRLRKNRVKDEWNYIVETAVFNELKARGMRVYIGKTYRGEVDFIAERDDRRCYIQAAYLMSDQATVDREFGAFAAIDDSYPRYVVSMDPIAASRDGIEHLRLVDFLSDEGLLRLA